MSECKHQNVTSHDSHGLLWSCDVCGTEFIHSGLLPGKVTMRPMPETPTLRDQFALTALRGILSSPEKAFSNIEEVATGVYLLADQMMKTRKA
jgi:hypothetical protein